MILATAEESRQIDRRAMEQFGIPEAALMESAGAAVVRLSFGEKEWRGQRAVIVCGTGNNGGDGFVAARYAAELGALVTVLLFGNPAHLGKASAAYRKAAETMGIPVVEISSAAGAASYLDGADVIIDALIGTGLTSAVTGEKAALIERMNAARGTVIAVDVPSGISADTGRASGAAVTADLTVALGTMKRCHVLDPGLAFCGRVRYASIGIPERAREGYPVRVTEAADVFRLLPRRVRTAHKGSNGFAGIFAGSDGMAGAGLLAAQGALYGGAGKTALCTVSGAARELTGKMPEVMVHGMGESACFNESFLERSLAEAAAFDVTALGCGFGRSEESQRFTEALLKKLRGPVVVDADALFAAAERKISFRDLPGGPFVLTPHVGEFSRLTGLSAVEIERDRIGAALSFAEERGVILVLKGVPTVTAFPDGRAWINPTGNPGMAAGGMGDTLTGIITALIGQGIEPGMAAVGGVYLHGLAGDLLAEEAAVGYTAGDVARKVPAAREQIRRMEAEA